MHKIKKGIKKKIKGKKHKEEELFTEEEYEKYLKQKEEEKHNKEEKEEKEETEEEEVHNYNSAVEANEDVKDDLETNGEKDWRNFLSSTDVVLKKTSENLEHIKEVSFYQTKRPEEEETESVKYSAEKLIQKNNWVDLDKGGFSDSENEEDTENNFQDTVKEKPLEEKVKELKDIAPIEEFNAVNDEDYADIFDTTYVDQVESGQIKLHIIPDSPTDLDPNEPDPFDTTSIEKVLNKDKPKSKKKKKNKEQNKPKQIIKPKSPSPPPKPKVVVNLGSAVQALTSDSPLTINHKSSEEKKEYKSKESDDINLFDANAEESIKQFDNTHSVVDILCSEVSEEKDTVLSAVSSPVKIVACDSSEINEKGDKDKKENIIKNIIDEFDIINKTDTESSQNNSNLYLIAGSPADEVEDEFSELAESSLKTKFEEDPFDTSAVENVIGKDENNPQPEDTEDPFNVDFAANLVQGSKNLSNKTVKVDLLATENIESDPFDTSEVSKIIPDPFETIDNKEGLPESLKPQEVLEVKDTETDPFDTSVADSFGKVELKVLETELLDNIIINQVKEEDDFDFNPRAGDVVIESTVDSCLLSTNNEEALQKVLTPQEVEIEETDPFDTSIADSIQKKALEEELLGNNKEIALGDIVANTLRKYSIVQDNAESVNTEEEKDPFDTSAVEGLCSTTEVVSQKQISSTNQRKLNIPAKPPRPPTPECLLASTPTDQNPTLLPTSKPDLKENCTEDDELDPFDTSIAAEFGKVELKVLESELLSKDITPTDTDFDNLYKRTIALSENTDNDKNTDQNIDPPVCLLTSSNVEEQQLPPLSPLKAEIFEQDNQDFDPFDTSAADKLGNSEVSFFESGLESKESYLPDSEKERSLPTHNSSTEQSDISNKCIFATTPADNNPPLQPFSAVVEPKEALTAEPEEIDPFDTSFANQFGKTELKALESELENLDSSFEVKKFSFLTNDSPQKSEEKAINLEIIDSILSQDSLDNTIPILEPTKSISTDIVDTVEYDPFDTSIADKFGKTEIKSLEAELLADSSLKRNLSDDEDFDPRKKI